MQKAKVMQLFRLFACLENAAPFADLAEAAMRGVSAELRTDADSDDIRLDYYAAACANLQYRRMIAAQTCSLTSAGSSAAQTAGDRQCSLAESLQRDYRKAAADLLRDDTFVFTGVPACPTARQKGACHAEP